MQHNYKRYLLTLGDLHHLSCLVPWPLLHNGLSGTVIFALSFLQMMGGYTKQAPYYYYYFYWVYLFCSCEMLFRWKTLKIFYLPGKLILSTWTLQNLRKDPFWCLFVPFLAPICFYEKLDSDLKGALASEGELSCLSVDRNNSMLLLCIS